MSKQFFDTNIIVYLTEEEEKARKCEALVEAGGVVSVQVLNESVNVLRKKNRMTYAEISEFLAVIKLICQVAPVTLETHEKALSLVEKYRFSWFDSLIVASALESDCDECWSEDMHDGLVVERSLTIKHPF